MSYSQIFREIYIRNKHYIRIYLCVALFLSIFFFYNGISIASNTKVLSETENAVLGGSFTTVLFIAANNANIPLSPSVALSCSAILSIMGEHNLLPQQMQGFSFGLMDIWGFRIFAFVWAALSILPRCSQFTRIGGLMMEDLEKKMGQIATLVVTVTQFVTNLDGGTVASAAARDGIVSTGFNNIHSYVYMLLSFIILVLLLICFLFIHTFLFFLDIIQIPICTLIPFTSAGSELIKIVGTIAMYSFILFAPGLFVFFYGVLLLVSIIFFKKAYISVRYFKEIYVKPFFRKLRGYDKEIALINEKAPKQILQECQTKDLQLLIPIYSVGKKSFSTFIKRHDKWWLAVTTTGYHLYQYRLFRKKLLHIPLILTFQKQIFLKNSKRFFEFFCPSENAAFSKSFRKLKKDWHFVFSNEYTYRYEEIVVLLKCTDYQQYIAAYKKAKH